MLAKICAAAALMALTVMAACSSGSSSGPGGGCTDYSGSWSLSGSCQDTSCAVTQNGCSITLNCSPTGTVYTGSVSGGSISFGDGSGTCSGSISGTSASGSCNDPSAGTCNWTASCNSGACTNPGAGGNTGSGGSGGGSGTDCSAACQAIKQCCPMLDVSQCLTGCAEAPPSCAQCSFDQSCGAIVPCAISNCGMPSEACSDA